MKYAGDSNGDAIWWAVKYMVEQLGGKKFLITQSAHTGGIYINVDYGDGYCAVSTISYHDVFIACTGKARNGALLDIYKTLERDRDEMFLLGTRDVP